MAEPSKPECDDVDHEMIGIVRSIVSDAGHDRAFLDDAVLSLVAENVKLRARAESAENLVESAKRIAFCWRQRNAVEPIGPVMAICLDDLTERLSERRA